MTKSAAKKPEAKSAAKKPEAKSAAKKPEAKSAAKKPEVKSAAKKPEVKSAAKILTLSEEMAELEVEIKRIAEATSLTGCPDCQVKSIDAGRIPKKTKGAFRLLALFSSVAVAVAVTERMAKQGYNPSTSIGVRESPDKVEPSRHLGITFTAASPDKSEWQKLLGAFALAKRGI